jgi:hypothetical protein
VVINKCWAEDAFPFELECRVQIPPKNRWKATASSGNPRLAIDDNYATTWILKPAKKPWLEIDLGSIAALAGVEVYWGSRAADKYRFESSLDGKTWAHLCITRHGEGGQDVFAFPPAKARFVRWTCENPEPGRGLEIVQINLYGPSAAASVLEEGRIAVLGHAPVKLPPGESVTVDFGYVRFPLGAVAGKQVWVNDRTFAVLSSEPEAVAIADFDDGGVIRLIENGPRKTARSLRSDSGLLSAACEFGFSLAPGGSIAFVVSSPMREDITPHADRPFDSIREAVTRIWRNKIGPPKITVGDQEVSDTVEAQTALILVNATQFAFKPGPRNYDRTWIRDGSAQALALLWAGLIEEAKAYVVWYSKRIYGNGMVPPILNVDGTVNQGYGSNIKFDAQGELVDIAAEVYRISRDRAFLNAIFEPVVRATKFIEELCTQTNALYGPETRFHGLLAPSISHEGYSKPSYSYWDNFFALSAWRNCEYLASEIGVKDIAASAKGKGQEFAANLARSIRMTSEELGSGFIHGSADREDVDPTSTSIAFEPCRVEDILPAEFIPETYDLFAARVKLFGSPDFEGSYTPYVIRNLNAFVSLGRFEDAFRLLSLALAGRRPSGWRHWAEVVWGAPRAPDYIGDMPHTWIGAEFATAIRRMLLRENGGTLELFRGARLLVGK